MLLPPPPAKQAFSLVELSIVLVILGLLTGAVLTGQNLIRAAELRKISVQIQQYESAIHSFRDRYFALPGDMTNATDFWGASANCPGSNTQGTTDGTTCNGDGNGIVDYAGASGIATTRAETYRFWQHLANAGLIEGQYNGVTGSTTNLYVWAHTTNNAPTIVDGAVIGVIAGDGSSMRYDYTYTPYSFNIGKPLTGNWNWGPFLLPEEVWNIDKKMDDGKPGLGAIITNVSVNCSGTSDDAVFDTDYNLSNAAKDCIIIYNPSKQ